MSAAQQPAFDEATQVSFFIDRSKDASRFHAALKLTHCIPLCLRIEGVGSVPGARTIKGQDAGIYPRIDGQVLEHVSPIT
jgi:hypothetical protein